MFSTADSSWLFGIFIKVMGVSNVNHPGPPTRSGANRSEPYLQIHFQAYKQYICMIPPNVIPTRRGANRSEPYLQIHFQSCKQYICMIPPNVIVSDRRERGNPEQIKGT